MNPLSNALVAMRRSPYQTLAAILIMSLTFFVGYTFSFFLLGTEQILKYFETRPQIIGFFELGTSLDTLTQVEQRMREKSYVDGVNIVSQEKALAIYQEDNQDDPLLLELVTADILPASIEVAGKSVNDLSQIKQDLEQTENIDDVIYQQDVIESLSQWTQSIRLVGLWSIVMLGLTAFLIVFIIISMKVTSKKQAIHIMRIIGASRWYITLPFIYEGLLYGLIGSMVGWCAMFAMLLYVTPWLKEFLGGINLLPVPPEILAMQVSIGTLLGMILGALTGTLAVKRMIKR